MRTELRTIAGLSVMIAGATAMSSQIVMFREFLVEFHGSEVSVGIILAGWLIWGAVGSWLLGSRADRCGPGPIPFSFCQLALALILPAALMALRFSRPVLGTVPGELVGYARMTLLTFAVLSLPCALMGFMFSLACRLHRDLFRDPAEGVARVYFMEAAGALAGGFLTSYFLIRFLPSMGILLFLSILNLAASAAMQTRSGPSTARRAAGYISIVVFAGIILTVLTPAGGRLQALSLARQWAGFDVLGSRNSVYGNITVTGRGEQRSFYENGLHLYTVPDRLSAENAVHFALLENRAPETVLLIGGGVGGSLAETLKHPVKKVDYLELDPVIVDMAKEYLAERDVAILDRPEVSVRNEDGIFFVKRTPERYDCVMVNMGDPYTAQLNRFYTVEFFREVGRILKKGGVASFSLTSSANYLSGELRDYLGSIYRSARVVFPEVLVLPGDTAHFLMSNMEGALTSDVGVLMGRLRDRGVSTAYVREYYLFDKLSPERVGYVRDALDSAADVPLNNNFKPIAYYYATLFWGSHFGAPFVRRAAALLTPENIWIAAVLFCLLLLAVFVPARRRRRERVSMLAVATTGFAEIIFQIAVIFSFQVIYGYIFYKIGVIVTSFMAGLALGGWIAARSMGRMKDPVKPFAWTQAAICLYPLLLPPLFMWLAGTKSAASAWMGANILLPFIPVVAGLIGGIQFPLANRIYLEGEKPPCETVGRTAGFCYGLDLVGACAGSFLAVAFLVPILGIPQVCLLAALINVTVMALLLLGIGSRTV